MYKIYGIFRELENNLSDTCKFLTILKETVDNYGIKSATKALKTTGIGINQYGEKGRYTELFRKSIDLLKKYVEKDTENEKILNKYIEQVKCLNLLFSDFYSKEEFEILKDIPDEYKLFSFLLILEACIRTLNDIKINNSRNKDKYLLNIDMGRAFGDCNKNLKDLSIEEFTSMIEHIMRSSCKVLQALLFHKYLYKNRKFKHCIIDKEIQTEYIINSIKHIEVIDIREIVFNLFEQWKFDDYSIEIKSNNLFKILPVNKKEFLNKNIELQRFENERIVEGFKGLKKKIKIDENTKQLPPNVALHKAELADIHTCGTYFSSETLEEMCNGIPLSQWIRAYSIIKKKNEDFLNKKTFSEEMKPKEWFLILTIDEWVDEFMKYGIASDNARRMINDFIFTKDSIDLFDSPFIKFEDNKVLTMPSYACSIQASISLISLMSRKGYNIAFKGSNYEKELIKEFRESGIFASGIKKNDEQGNEYECDLAFVIGKDLFLCECKKNFQPLTPRKRFEFKNKKLEDIAQIKRISTFYDRNIHYVREALKLGHDWKPRRVYRFVIYSCKLGEVEKKDDVTLVDDSILMNCISKKLPSIVRGGETKKVIVLKSLSHVFEGKMTTHKLLTYIENSMQISYQKYRTDIVEKEIPVNYYNVCILSANTTIDNFYPTK